MPNPSEKNGSDRNVVLQGLVRADSMLQIALAIPLSTLIGWGIGVWLDHKLHHSWIPILGLILGAAAGFVQIIRLANQANRRADK